jgi:cyclophilin family peptidyl-prolyl cis-trans isomerase
MSSARHSPRAARFAPRVEGLEDRTVPSGNVQAFVFDNVLYVAGDDQANQIMIKCVGDDGATVSSLDGTPINGQAGPVPFFGVDGICARMYGGDDVLLVVGPAFDDAVDVDMGDGNDYVSVSGASHGGDTVIRTGAGDDIVSLSGSDFNQTVSVDTGAGDDFVALFWMSAETLRMTNPAGTDHYESRIARADDLEIFGLTPGTRPVAPDTTRPAAVLTSSTPNVTNAGAIDYTVTFSEPVTGFTAGGIAVTNGTVASVTQVNAQTYTFRVTPAGQGAVSATVLAGAALDAAGNANTASDAVSRTFDSVAPAAPTLALAPASDSGTVGDLRTDQTAVTLTGKAEAGATVTLTTTAAPAAPGTGPVVAQTTAAADGSFTFGSVALALGPNSLVVRATDAAGNAGATFAQTFTRDAPPTVATPVADQTFNPGDTTPRTFDLATVFDDAERVVRLSVTYPNGQTGFIDVNLFASAAPNTVANFLAYANSANPAQSYDGSIFHRLVPGFVLQGGGFTFDDTTKTFTALTKMGPVANEPGVANTLGTIAMAKIGTDPNSATDEFFFNLGDNSTNLDQQNGGFTVFGQVMNGGQQTVNAITSAVTTYSGPGVPGAPPFPVSPTANTTNFPQNITPADLASVTGADELTRAQKMTFAVAGNTNPLTATASVSGSTLTVTPLAVGTTVITVRATDLDGSSTTTSFTVMVS